MHYLTKAEIITINQQLIQRAGTQYHGVQDQNGLDSVVKQPQMVMFGRELYPTIWLKAAYLMQKITKKHLFMDGNKRTAYVCTKLFLLKNGYHLKVTKNEGVALMLGVTTHDDSEKIMIEVAEFLKKHSTKL